MSDLAREISFVINFVRNYIYDGYCFHCVLNGIKKLCFFVRERDVRVIVVLYNRCVLHYTVSLIFENQDKKNNSRFAGGKIRVRDNLEA